ncbi:MAG TPA: hypothetical protein VH478_13185 [Trebonia sp.]|nr:hypothetical protein [Trebonia sp.]
MTTLTALARALAVESGYAQPVRTVRHVHLSDRPLVFIPLQLAGEANAPLAALVGDDREKPRLLAVYEPRNRNQRFEFAAELAESVILPYIEGYAAGEPGEKDAYADAPQVLVPGPAAVTFTRLLGRSTRFRRTDGEWAVPASVPVLGWWLTYLAERAEHPSSSLLLPMTKALSAHWATGQSEAEDQNLASLVRWIAPPPGMTGFEAAREAEDPQAWPPAGPATDPDFDRDVLVGLIAMIRDASGVGGAALERARGALAAALATQLEQTWALMWQGVDLLRSLPEGGHVAGRWGDDRFSFTTNMRYFREGGFPQARRDGAVRAAARLSRLEREQRELEVGSAYDDPLVMAEYRMTGEAFRGTVTEAQRDRRVQEPGKKGAGALRPLIVVEAAEDVLVAPDAKVTCPAHPKQKGVVRDVRPQPGGATVRVEIELSGGMGRGSGPAPAGTMPAVGEAVVYTTLTGEFMPLPKFPDPELTPWTHGGPPPPYVPRDEDGNEAWQ